MMKYVFKQIDDISGANAVTTIEFSADYLPDVLEHVEMFIRGSGFIVSGKLDFIDYEDPYTTPKFEPARDEDEELDADLGAYLLLSRNNNIKAIKPLLKHFKERHGIKFDEKLLDRVKKHFPE